MVRELFAPSILPNKTVSPAMLKRSMLVLLGLAMLLLTLTPLSIIDLTVQSRMGNGMKSATFLSVAINMPKASIQCCIFLILGICSIGAAFMPKSFYSGKKSPSNEKNN